MSLGLVALVVRKALVAGFSGLMLSGACPAEEHVDPYRLSPAAVPLDLGIQPLGYPSAPTSAFDDAE